MMHSMFPIIPLATDPGDLRPVESLALTTPLVVAIVACLLLAVGLIALIIMLSRPARLASKHCSLLAHGPESP